MQILSQQELTGTGTNSPLQVLRQSLQPFCILIVAGLVKP